MPGLLLKPCGFEGLVPRKEHRDALNPAIRDLDHLCGLAGKVDAAFGPMQGPLHPQHHRLTSRSHIDDGELRLPDNAGLVGQLGSDRIPAPHHLRIGKVWGVVPFTVLRPEPPDGLRAVLTPGLGCAAGQLNVLLRHRPRSISFAGAHRFWRAQWHSDREHAPQKTWRLGRSQTPRPTPAARRLRGQPLDHHRSTSTRPASRRGTSTDSRHAPQPRLRSPSPERSCG